MSDQSNRWIKEVKWYNGFDLHALIAAAVDEGGAATFAEGALLASPLDATVRQAEIEAMGMAGILMAQDDLLYGYFAVPHDLDPAHEVGFRVRFTQSADVSVGVTWVLEVGKDLADAVMQQETALAALDTVIVEKNAAGAGWGNHVTARGIKNKNWFTREEIENGAIIRVSLEADVVDGTIADLRFMQLGMDYTPMRCVGPGNAVGAPLQADGVA